MSDARAQTQVIGSMLIVAVVVGTVTTATVAGVAVIQQEGNTLSGTPAADIVSCVNNNDNVRIEHRGGDTLQRDDLIAVFERGGDSEIRQLSAVEGGSVDETLSRGETWVIETSEVPPLALVDGVPAGRLELRHNPTNTLVLGSTSLGRCDDTGPDVNIVEPDPSKENLSSLPTQIRVEASDENGIRSESVEATVEAENGTTLARANLTDDDNNGVYDAPVSLPVAVPANGTNLTVEASAADTYDNYGTDTLDVYVRPPANPGGQYITNTSGRVVGSDIVFGLHNNGTAGANVTDVEIVAFNDGTGTNSGTVYAEGQGNPTLRTNRSGTVTGRMDFETQYAVSPNAEIPARNGTKFRIGAFRNASGPLNLAAPNLTLAVTYANGGTDTFRFSIRLADPGFAYKDLNKNGVWNPGTDERIDDIGAEIQDGSYDAGDEDLVIPPSVGDLSVKNTDLELTGESVTLGTSVNVNNGGITITATDGNISGTNTSLESKNSPVQLSASKDITITGSSLTADNSELSIDAGGAIRANDTDLYSKNNPITLSADDNVYIEDSAVTAENSRVDVTSEFGSVFGDRSTFESKNNPVTVTADEGVHLNDSSVIAPNSVASVTAQNGAVFADGLTMESNNNPSEITAGGDIRLADANVYAQNSRVAVDAGGDLYANGTTFRAKNNPIELSAGASMRLAAGVLFADNGQARATVSTGPLYVEGLVVNDRDAILVYSPNGVRVVGSPSQGSVTA
jgi:hypothetical protein